MSETWKAFGEVWSRLFDHRPVLNGEIRFFVKEFKEKRAHKEVDRLLKSLEQAIDLKEIHFIQIDNAAKDNLKVLNDKLQTAFEYSEKIQKSFEQLKKDNEEKALKRKEERQRDLQVFVDDMNFKRERIDNAFTEKIQELRDFYTDLDHKLDLIK